MSAQIQLKAFGCLGVLISRYSTRSPGCDVRRLLDSIIHIRCRFTAYRKQWRNRKLCMFDVDKTDSTEIHSVIVVIFFFFLAAANNIDALRACDSMPSAHKAWNRISFQLTKAYRKNAQTHTLCSIRRVGELCAAHRILWATLFGSVRLRLRSHSIKFTTSSAAAARSGIHNRFASDDEK